MGKRSWKIGKWSMKLVDSNILSSLPPQGTRTWCRRRDELLLVYDYVPNGSLDKLLLANQNQKKKVLTWEQRYKILIGIAQAWLYLHEECDQRVVHRDVKPSNVLINAGLNPRLSDFGLARTYEHGINPQTTHIVGTWEVATGGRPIKPQRNVEELVLVDWVRELHSQEAISKAIDPGLEEYNPEEAELVLGLVSLCSHPNPDYGPSTRRVVQFSLGDANLPQLPHDLYLEAAGVITDYLDIYADDSDPSCGRGTSSTSTSFAIFDKKVFSKQATRVTF
ncbi:hypothetical protein ACSBR1_019237 [Camellia fascicularis]